MRLKFPGKPDKSDKGFIQINEFILFFSSVIILLSGFFLNMGESVSLSPDDAAEFITGKFEEIFNKVEENTLNLAGTIRGITDPDSLFINLSAYVNGIFPELNNWNGNVVVLSPQRKIIAWEGETPDCNFYSLSKQNIPPDQTRISERKPVITVDECEEMFILISRISLENENILEIIVPLEFRKPFSRDKVSLPVYLAGISGVDFTFSPGVAGRADSIENGITTKNIGLPVLLDGKNIGYINAANPVKLRKGSATTFVKLVDWSALIVFLFVILRKFNEINTNTGFFIATVEIVLFRFLFLFIPGVENIMFGSELSGPEHYASIAGFGLLRSPADLFLSSLISAVAAIAWVRNPEYRRRTLSGYENSENGRIRALIMFVIAAAMAWFVLPRLLFSLSSSAPGFFPPFRGVFFSPDELILTTSGILLTAGIIFFSGSVTAVALSLGFSFKKTLFITVVPGVAGWLWFVSSGIDSVSAALVFLVAGSTGAWFIRKSMGKGAVSFLSRLLWLPPAFALMLVFSQQSMNSGETGWKSAAIAQREGESVWIRILVKNVLEEFAHGKKISAFGDLHSLGSKGAYEIWLNTGLASEGIPSSIKFFDESGEEIAAFSAWLPSWFNLDELDLIEEVGAGGDLVVLRGWEQMGDEEGEEIPFYTGRVKVRGPDGKILQIVVTALGSLSGDSIPARSGEGFGYSLTMPADSLLRNGLSWKVTFFLGVLGLSTMLVLLSASVLLKTLHKEANLKKMASSFRFRLLIAMVILSLLPILFWGIFAVNYRMKSLDKQHVDRISRGLTDMMGVLESERINLAISSHQKPQHDGMDILDDSGISTSTGFLNIKHGDGGQAELFLDFEGNDKEVNVGFPLDEAFCRDMAALLSGDVRVYSGSLISADSRPEYLISGIRRRRMRGDVYRDLVYGGKSLVLAEEKIGGVSHMTGYRILSDKEGRYAGAVALTLQAFEKNAAIERSVFTADITGLAALWVLLTMAGSLFLSGKISDSIGRVTIATEKMANGRFGRIPELSSMDEVRRLVSSFNIMSDRLAAHREILERNRNFLSTTLNNLDTAVLATDFDGKVVFVNLKMREIVLNYSENKLTKLSGDVGSGESDDRSSLEPEDWPVGFNASKILKDAGLEKTSVMLDGILKGEGGEKSSMTISPRDGEDGDATWRITVNRLGSGNEILGGVVVIEDLTDIVRSRKIVAWGQMARQIAHEIKNPLTPVKLQAQHIVQAWKDNADNFDEILKESIDVIIEQIERLRKIATEFSWFAGRPDRKPVEVNIGVVVSEILSGYGFLSDENSEISVELSVEDSLPPVMMAEEELRRVVVNLVENAVQACSAVDSTREKSIKVELNMVRIGEKAGQELVISDTGEGIPPHVVERLFEPYFSTRTGGTGLGLPIVQSILDRYGASISIDSREDKGTTVKVFFPASMIVMRSGNLPESEE